MSYVFIGHGWNLEKTINLEKYNATVIMLSEPTCLFDENRKHRQLLMQHAKSLQDYLQNLLHPKGVINDFCEYSKMAPELLLTTYTKHPGESSFLIKFGNIRSEPDVKVMLLSEILDKLSKQENNNPLLLIIYACRCPLDHFQLDNLFQFGEKALEEIQAKIKVKNITILQGGAKTAEVKCESKV